MLTPQIKSKLGSNGLNPKWWPRNEILHAFGLSFSSLRIFVDLRVVRIKKHDPCSLRSAPPCVHSNLKRFNRLSEKGSELKRKILETILQLSICLSCISITFIRTLMKMGVPMEICAYWQNVATFVSAVPPSQFIVRFNTIMFWLLIERINRDNHNHCQNLQAGQSG